MKQTDFIQPRLITITRIGKATHSSCLDSVSVQSSYCRRIVSTMIFICSNHLMCHISPAAAQTTTTTPDPTTPHFFTIISSSPKMCSFDYGFPFVRPSIHISKDYCMGHTPFCTPVHPYPYPYLSYFLTMSVTKKRRSQIEKGKKQN